jgi:ATP-binding cassette subfamily B protein
LADFHAVPFNRDNLLDQVDALLQRQDKLNLINIGQLLNSLDLSVSLVEIPRAQLSRVPCPAVFCKEGHITLLEGIDPTGELRLLDPELGPLRVEAKALQPDGDGDRLSILLLRRRPDSKEQRFSWAWYGPFLKPHRRELVEVLVTSGVVNVLALVTPLGIMRLVNARTGGDNSLDAVVSIGVILIAASVVTAIASALRSLIFTGVANRVDMDTRETILDRLVRLPQGFFDARPVGRITYYFNMLDRLRDFLIGQALTTLVDFSFSLLYVAVLFSLNPLLTLVTLSTLPLFVVLALIANPIVENQIDRMVEEGVKTNSYLTEAITGIQTIKSQNAELKTRWDFQDRYSRFIGEDFKLKVSGETVGALAKFLGELSGIATMVLGVWLVSRNELSIGALFAFRIIGDRVTGPMVQLVQTWQQFKIQSRNLVLAADVVDRPTEQSDRQASNIPMPPLEGKISIQNVDFRYDEAGQQILYNVSLDVPVGTFVGMVGGSGSGKSTVLKLLPRFYEPESGRIKIDGLDISKVELYSLRRQIGVVPQDSLLFDGTIKENLLMVKPDATSEELIRAAQIACAHDFIMEMPQGYNSPVGERGAGLSGGQRQRMALARAVLQNPRMLILDEATSALDATTERQVCLNLFEAFRGRTVFFITHRLSTVRPADLIVLMDQGAVMEVGNHPDLMQRRGWYYALVQSQAQEGLN